MELHNYYCVGIFCNLWPNFDFSGWLYHQQTGFEDKKQIEIRLTAHYQFADVIRRSFDPFFGFSALQLFCLNSHSNTYPDEKNRILQNKLLTDEKTCAIMSPLFYLKGGIEMFRNVNNHGTILIRRNEPLCVLRVMCSLRMSAAETGYERI